MTTLNLAADTRRMQSQADAGVWFMGTLRDPEAALRGAGRMYLACRVQECGVGPCRLVNRLGLRDDAGSKPVAFV